MTVTVLVSVTGQAVVVSFYHLFCIPFAFCEHLSWTWFLPDGHTSTCIPEGSGLLVVLP